MKVIDAHIHVQPLEMLKPEVYKVLISRRKDASKVLSIIEKPSNLLKYLDSQGVDKTVLINYPSPKVMGFTERVNDFVLDYTKNNRKRLLPCGGIMFNRTAATIKRKIKRYIKNGMKAFKIQTGHQLYYPNDYINNAAMRAFYKTLENEGIPVIIHTGTSIFPDARNKYSDPLYVDEVAVDYPELKIVIAHIGRPLWPKESLFLLRRHKNVYGDISSIPPKNLLEYFPKLKLVADKILFGSDWPAPGVPDIGVNISNFMRLKLPKETKHNILLRNAFKVFNWE